jgi:hypothetical protein
MLAPSHDLLAARAISQHHPGFWHGPNACTADLPSRGRDIRGPPEHQHTLAPRQSRLSPADRQERWLDCRAVAPCAWRLPSL